MGLSATIHTKLPVLTSRIFAYTRRHLWIEPLAALALSGVVYAIGFSLSISTFLKDDLAVCWPLVGLQVAVFLRLSRRHWPVMLAGMVISQIILEWWEPADEIHVDALGDVAEVVLAAYALPAFNGLSDWIRQPRLLQRFMVWPMILGPALTAFPVAAVFARELHIGFWGYWTRWFTGDMLGIVLWLPLGLILLSSETYELFKWRALPRTLGMIGLLTLAGWLIFDLRPTPVAFILFPILLLIAFKLGFSGAVIAANILCVLGAKGTLHHLGPFGKIAEPYDVMMLQLFLAVSMLVCFPVSIILLERNIFEREMKDAYAHMEHLAISDGLTGLANRRQFDSVFAEEWRRAMRAREPIAILMIDVDCFKLYNDLYGHLAGDDCLRKIADSIRSSVKRAGDLTARFGGEEFVLLMPRTNLSGALEVAENVRFHVELMRLEHSGNPHRIVTISIGCWSVIPKPDMLPDALIELADQGLYSAKQEGRNRVAIFEETGLPANVLLEC